MNAKNVAVRALSGAVYVGLIVCSILFGQGWAFPLLCCLFTLIGIIEFQKMSQDDFYKSPRSLFVDLLIGLSMPAFVAFYLMGYAPIDSFLFMFAILLVVFRMVMELYCHRSNPVRHIGVSIMSVVYVAVPLSFAVLINAMNPRILLLMFVMIWLNDTGAFLVGSTLGSHRLFERLSPKKSWEGFFGGLVAAIACGYVAKAIFPDSFHNYNAMELGAVGAVVSVMSTWGDLFESMIKRTFGVKDSGNIIPGHGGILDRIDSLLFVAPAIVIMIAILRYFEAFTLIQGA